MPDRQSPVAKVGGFAAPIDTTNMPPEDKAGFQFAPDVHPGVSPHAVRPGHMHFLDSFKKMFGIGQPKPAPSPQDAASAANSAKINAAYNFATKKR